MQARYLSDALCRIRLLARTVAFQATEEGAEPSCGIIPVRAASNSSRVCKRNGGALGHYMRDRGSNPRTGAKLRWLA